MHFSIITPSYRNSQWLRLCIASVADQQEVEVEHIVQDSCSDDGTQEWLPGDRRVRAFIEKDTGMYDAVNRGFRRASGDLLAYLNCDEQYLPGALKAVHDYFAEHPAVDVLLSDTVVTDGKGDYICHRYSLVPGNHQIWVRFPVLTCSMFIRRRVLDHLGLYFDTKWRDLGDFFWVLEMLLKGVPMAVLPRFTSVFADTGENMNLKPNALRERGIKYEMTPRWVKLFQLPFAIHYRLRLAVRGAPFQKPFDYWLYTIENTDRRVRRTAAKPTSFWKRGSSSLAGQLWQNAWTLKNQ
jgi:glycosyltransferase involved in cell wall biosynthesis